MPATFTGWKTSQEKKNLAKQIRLLLKKLDTELDRPDNPVADFLADRSRSILQFEDRTNERMLEALIDETAAQAGLIEALRQQVAEGKTSPSFPIQSPALDHLIATQYVNSQAFARQAILFKTMLTLMNFQGLNPGVMQNLKRFVDDFGSSAKLVLAAKKAGDSVERLELPDLKWPRDNGIEVAASKV